MDSKKTHPILTIITIVRDDPTGLTRTLNSFDKTDLDQIEVLIIDSSALQKNTQNITEGLLPPATFSWTPPRGIFNAMNTGLAMANGDYIWFINAGDELTSPIALESVLNALTFRPNWLFGQVEFTRNGESGITPPPFDYEKEKQRRFSQGRFPPHQGTIVRTQLARELGGFDETYAIAADYHLMLKLSEQATPTEITNTIARFWTGGTSSKNWRQAIREFHRARIHALELNSFARIVNNAQSAMQFLRMAAGRIMGRDG